MTRRLLAVSLALLATGCTLGPDYQRPVVPTPAEYRDAAPGQDAATIADLPWWTVFKDPALLSLATAGLVSLVISTYQAVSGSGVAGVEELATAARAPMRRHRTLPLSRPPTGSYNSLDLVEQLT